VLERKREEPPRVLLREPRRLPVIDVRFGGAAAPAHAPSLPLAFRRPKELRVESGPGGGSGRRITLGRPSRLGSGTARERQAAPSSEPPAANEPARGDDPRGRPGVALVRNWNHALVSPSEAPSRGCGKPDPGRAVAAAPSHAVALCGREITSFFRPHVFLEMSRKSELVLVEEAEFVDPLHVRRRRFSAGEGRL